MIYWKANERNEWESSSTFHFSNFSLLLTSPHWKLSSYWRRRLRHSSHINTMRGIKWNSNEWVFAEGYVEANAHANGPPHERKKIIKKLNWKRKKWRMVFSNLEKNEKKKNVKSQWIIHFIAIFIALWGWYSWIDEVEMSEYLLSPFQTMHTLCVTHSYNLRVVRLEDVRALNF